MLLENKEYVVIKLHSGEEVIGKVVDSDSTTLTLGKPRVLVVQQGAEGQTAGLAPLLQLADPDKNVVFARKYIASSADMMDQVKDDYVRATSPLIQAPSTGSFKI